MCALHHHKCDNQHTNTCDWPIWRTRIHPDERNIDMSTHIVSAQVYNSQTVGRLVYVFF